MTEGPAVGGPSTERTAAQPSLDEVVLTAAGLDDEERERYLDDVAASAGWLAAEARRRIAAATDLRDSFLDIPAAARLGGEAPVARHDDSSLPVRAMRASERYQLGELLGQGGMGRVVKAFDRQLGRPVALKFLAHENPAVLRFFLREARAQARVQHPHVLEIYDGGELDGEPFIAMRFVDGGTLADIGTTLSIEGRVRLLIQVAEGLHAAHREGLLHRDVKPANVLVHETSDGQLEALVSDFGLASELGDAETTAGGALAGSPHYIAPERLAEPGGGSVAGAVAAVVDRRSDVYSLGVTMYRLLTGELPFSDRDTVEVLRGTLAGELPPPRHRMPSLPIELEAIILRCTARDPGQRYATARAVAADLQRYLDGEVVEAHAAGLAYRLTRFVLRNKLVVGLAGVAATALLIASIAVTVFALRAQAARTRAELRQGQAEELIRFMVVDLRGKLESLGRLDILDEVGRAALEYFEAVPDPELSKAELERRSQMLYQVGDVRIKRGDLPGAVAAMEQSLALAQRLAALEPDASETLFNLGQSQYWVGFVHWEQGNLAAARQPFEAYLEISRRLVEKDPTNLDWQRELSYAHSNLGSVRQAEGDPEAALEQFLATLAIDEVLVAADPTSEQARSELAATHNTVGVVLQELGRLRAAGDHLRADLEIRQALAAEHPGSPRARDFLAASHGQTGIQLFMQGELGLAEQHFQTMRELFAGLVGHDPSNTGWRLKLAWADLELGRVALAHGQLETADKWWREQRRLVAELLTLDPTPPKWRRTEAIGLYHRALLQRLQGDEAQARASVRAAIATLEELATAQAADRSVPRWLGHAYLLLGRLEGTPTAAHSAFERAAAVVAPFARHGRDGRLLAPWVAAMICLGRAGEAQSVALRLRASGYVEPELDRPCPG